MLHFNQFRSYKKEIIIPIYQPKDAAEQKRDMAPTNRLILTNIYIS